MKPQMAMAVLGLIGSPLFAAKAVLTREVLSALPANVDIQSPQYKDAKTELEDLVARCGPGVVKAVAARNNEARNSCAFQVELDELFFKPLTEKTGLIQDPNWMYQDGVTWFEPLQVDTVPDNFDLRDLMAAGQPVIKKQNCGDCWAWATHHGLEIARAVHDQKVFDLSVQTVLSCSHKGSCSGGYMSAVDFLKHGLPLSTVFPYAGTNKSCKFSSSEIDTGWDGKAQATPNVGSSLNYSLAMRQRDGTFREGTKVQNMMSAMYQWKSPLVVTVSAYSISGPGIYNSCSAINSGGNHMVAIVGWDTTNGKRNAHVWNSWGQSHGDKGVSRIQWECGDGRLNRGLGVEAKIVQYKAPCTPPNASQVYLQEIQKGGSIQIGSQQAGTASCSWSPAEGLANPSSCVTKASPNMSTEYHLTVQNDCGKSTSMTLVYVWGRARGEKNLVRTPYGDVEYDR